MPVLRIDRCRADRWRRLAVQSVRQGGITRREQGPRAARAACWIDL